jgi:co-chaperonin GroES (HSP10)
VIKSVYLEKLQKAIEAVGPTNFVIPGALLLVEKIPKREIKSKGGIIIADTSKKQTTSVYGDLPQEVIVVAVGAGFENEGQDVPLDTKVGDILIVGDHAVKWLGGFPVDGYEPNTLGICSEENTQARFRGVEQYDAFQQATVLVAVESLP